MSLTIWPLISFIAIPSIIFYVSYSFAFTNLPEIIENVFNYSSKAAANIHDYSFNWYDPAFFVALVLVLYFAGPFLIFIVLFFSEYDMFLNNYLN